MTNNSIAPDALFPHTSDLEIPILLEDYQANFVDLPVRGWGSVSRTSQFRGTWHFYTDDSKFSALWKHPEAMQKTKAVNAVEPNFTTDWQMPYPVVLYRIYQKRWLARYWQTFGLGIFVDLNVPSTLQQFNLNGVPYGWLAYATAASDKRLNVLEEHAEAARTRAMTDNYRLLVYGGGPDTAKLCEKNNWVHVKDARNEVRDGRGR